MTNTLPSFCLAAALAVTPWVAQAQTTHAVAKLVKETTVAEPGKTMWLGVSFKIEKGWHIYWDGRNDTGTAPEFKVTLPDGWTLGKARWSTPDRHATEGDIVDYTYENETMILMPLEVPANVAVGEVVEVKIDANWLACSNVCLPEKGSLSTQVRVGTPGGAQPVKTQVEAFAKARATQPKPMAEAGDAFTAKIDGEVLKITAKDADRVVFMPASTGRPLANAFAEGESKGPELSAELGEADDTGHGVVGIVQLWKGKESKSYWLELNEEAPAGNKPTGSNVEHKPETP